MNIIDLLLISLALSLDAFSVSITCGIKLKYNNYKKFLKIALAFGLFQAFMPLLGFMLAEYFIKDLVTQYADWIAFLVFFILALKTFYDQFKDSNQEDLSHCNCEGMKCLTSLAIATSIDAFVVGAALGVKTSTLYTSVITIGIITFLNSMIGCLLGNKSMKYFQSYSRIIAGVVLLALAIKSIVQ